MFKTPSTPANPEAAILGGLRRWASPPTGEIIHGSTVATNALLERKGARTALVTTAGFEDVLAIGRQTRPDLYDIFTTRPEPLVGRRWRIGVRQRTLADGTREISPSPGEIRALVPRLRRWGIESVAVCLLFSFDAPEDERAIRDLLAPLGIPISLSSEILPEYREYERTSTTVVNAYLRPVMERYLGRLDRKLAAGGRRKLPQAPGSTRKLSKEIPLLRTESPPIPAQPGDTKTGLSHRRSEAGSAGNSSWPLVRTPCEHHLVAG